MHRRTYALLCSNGRQQLLRWRNARRAFSKNANEKANQRTKTTGLTDIKLFESALRKLEELRKFDYWKKAVIISSVGFVGCAGAYLYLFGEDVRDKMAEEVSTVAKLSLDDESLLSKTEQLSKDIVYNLLHDPTMKKNSVLFVKEVLTNDETKNAAVELLLGVVCNPNFVNAVAIELKAILLGILQKNETREIVQAQIERILHDSSVKSALDALIDDLLHTPQVQSMLTDLLRDVLASKAITEQGSKLGQEITANVISDKSIQEQAGTALWSAIKYSIIPKRFTRTSAPGEEVET